MEFFDCVGVLAYEGGQDSGQFLGQVVGGRPYGGDNGSHWDLYVLCGLWEVRTSGVVLSNLG